MTKRKTAVQPREAAVGILQKAAKAIGSVMGTLAAKTGMADAEAQPKIARKTVKATQAALPPARKRPPRKTATKKKPAVKRDRRRKPDSPATNSPSA